MKHLLKIAAIAIIAMFLLHSCGLLYTIGARSAFVQAASDTYSMTNVIYFNRTGLNRAGCETDCITITENAQTLPDDFPLKQPLTKDAIHAKDFAPNVTVDTEGFQSFYEMQDTVGDDTMTFAGLTMNISQARYMIADQFADGMIIPINTSDWFACGFPKADISFPVVKKSLVFDSPLNYVQRYCNAHGYTLRAILNSTYTKEYNMDTLNIFHSELVKEDQVIFYNQTPVPLYKGIERFGGGLVKNPIWAGYYFLLAVGILLTIIAIPVLITLINNQQARAALSESNAWNFAALGAGLDTVKYVVDHLTGAKTAERQLVIELYANGTIGWPELQYLLVQIDGSYNPLINNATANIGIMVGAYFNATVNLYGEYPGLADETSWTDWLYNLVILIVVGFAIYIVYALFIKRKTAQAPIASVVVVR
jgi:hypothetical protein